MYHVGILITSSVVRAIYSSSVAYCSVQVVMAPKRTLAELREKSIYDEILVEKVMPNPDHRIKMWSWLINHPEANISDIPLKQMSLPKTAIQTITQEFVKFTTKIVERNESSRGDTTKLLIELQDGHRIETVVMRHKGHSTVCVSSQIGCKMGCRWWHLMIKFGFRTIYDDAFQVLCNRYNGHHWRFNSGRDSWAIGSCEYGYEDSKCCIYGNGRAFVSTLPSPMSLDAMWLVFINVWTYRNNYENVKKAVEFMVDNRRFGLCKSIEMFCVLVI